MNRVNCGAFCSLVVNGAILTFLADTPLGEAERMVEGPAGTHRRAAAVSEWFDADEACRYLSLPSRKSLYQAVRRGQLPVHRLGRRMRFNRAELDALLLRR
jgi:excisionase family DNA binding protein